jgi:putative aldouronate transport system permease protein
MAVTDPTTGSAVASAESAANPSGLPAVELGVAAQPPTRGRRRRGAPGRPVWMEPPSMPAQIAKAILLVLVAFVMVFPFVYIIAVSFSSAQDVLGGGLILWPKNPTLEAYRAILRGGVVARALIISIGLVAIGTTAKMLATVSLAYGLSKRGVPGARFVLFLVLGTLLFSPGLIPSYLLVKTPIRR